MSGCCIKGGCEYENIFKKLENKFLGNNEYMSVRNLNLNLESECLSSLDKLIIENQHSKDSDELQKIYRIQGDKLIIISHSLESISLYHFYGHQKYCLFHLPKNGQALKIPEDVFIRFLKIIHEEMPIENRYIFINGVPVE